jgi:hypothetical protein
VGPFDLVNGQRPTLTGPRPGLGGPGLGRIWAELGRAGPPRGEPRRCHVALRILKTDSGPRGVAHGGLVSAVHGRPQGSRWTASTVLFSLTAYGAPGAQTGSASAPPPLFLLAVRRRRRAPACSTWWRSRMDPSGPTTLLGLREGDKGVLAADLSS